jgi:hypothetical protein
MGQITEIRPKEAETLTLQSSPEHKIRSTDVMANQEGPISQPVIELCQSGNNLRMSSCLGECPG